MENHLQYSGDSNGFLDQTTQLRFKTLY